MAYEIVAGLCVSYLAFAGFTAWFQLHPDKTYLNTDLNLDPWFGKSQFVEDHLIAPMYGYQIFNIIVCLFLSEFRTLTMLGHHVVTLILAHVGLRPYLHYYAIFFFGIAEFTNVPLTFVDIFKYFPDIAVRHPVINKYSRIVFGVTFVLIRLVLWPIQSGKVWFETMELFRNNAQGHPLIILIFFVIANVFLTGLQFYWGVKIVKSLFSPKQEERKSK